VRLDDALHYGHAQPGGALFVAALSALDDGNLVATVGMDEYYATLAESWMGVPANEVLPGSPTPLAGVV